jgi:hypothetical protein
LELNHTDYLRVDDDDDDQTFDTQDPLPDPVPDPIYRPNPTLNINPTAGSTGSLYEDDPTEEEEPAPTSGPTSAPAPVIEEVREDEVEATEDGKIVVENVSRFSMQEMLDTITEVEKGSDRTKVIVLHFTSKANLKKIFQKGSKGLRASTAGQKGGGLSVVYDWKTFLANWEKWGNGGWPEWVGKQLWNEKWEKVLPGGSDHQVIQRMIVLAVDETLVNADTVVHGRHHVRIIPHRRLQPDGDSFYLGLHHVRKAYALDRTDCKADGCTKKPIYSSGYCSAECMERHGSI